MMTSLRKTPLSRRARSSLVTVMLPLQGGAGYWINLEVRGQKFPRQDRYAPPLDNMVVARTYLVESCCRPETLTTGFLQTCWFLPGVLVS